MWVSFTDTRNFSSSQQNESAKGNKAKQFANWKWLQVQDSPTKNYLALNSAFYEKASRIM